MLTYKGTKEQMNWQETQSMYQNNFFDIQPPKSLFKQEIRNKIRQEYSEEWERIRTCRMTKKIYPYRHSQNAK